MFDAAVAGVGYTDFTAQSPQSTLELAREACAAAIADAGLDGGGRRRHRELHGHARFGAHPGGRDRARGCRSCASRSTSTSAARRRATWLRRRRRRSTTGQAKAVLVFRALNGRSGPRVGAMQFPGGGGQYRYPHRLQRLPHVRRDVGPALPRRDRPGRRRSGCRRGGPARVRDGQPARVPPPAADPRAVPRRALRRRSVPRAGLHDRGRRCLRRARHLARTGARPAAPTGRRRGRRLPRGTTARASTSATTCPGATTPATTPAGSPTTCSPQAGIGPQDVAVRRDLRLLHQHRPDGPGGAAGSASAGESGAFVRSGGTRARPAGCRPTRTAACSPRATCTA